MKIDMSPHAITMRLKRTSELRRLCFALGGDRLKARLQNANVPKSAVSPILTGRKKVQRE